MTTEEMLQAMLDREGVRYFKAREFLWLPWWKRVATPGEVREVLGNILPTALFLDGLREAWGAPVGINSGVRPLAYNRLVDSQDTSQHVLFKAVDCYPINRRVRDFQDLTLKEVKRVKDESGLIIRVGLYDRFVHLDNAGHLPTKLWDRRTSQ